MDGPPKRENPHPSELGGKKGNGSEVSQTVTTNGCHEGDSTPRKTVDDYTRERYWLDGQVKRVLRADAKKTSPEQHPANVHRTVACTWVRIADLSLVKPVGRDSYHWKGLSTCGSVHACCICAPRCVPKH